MQKLITRYFLRKLPEAGSSAMEYSLLLAGLVLVLLLIIGGLGQKVGELVNLVSN